jgi:aromatic ring-cleaving dioxygenase
MVQTAVTLPAGDKFPRKFLLALPIVVVLALIAVGLESTAAPAAPASEVPPPAVATPALTHPTPSTRRATTPKHPSTAAPGPKIDGWDGIDNAHLHACECTPETTTIRSYHIHILYFNNATKDIFNDNPHNEVGARALEQEFINQFDVPECVENTALLFNQSGLCAFHNQEPGVGPAGYPFTTPQFGFFVPLDRLHDTVPWILHNRKNYDILVHPNSCGFFCAAEDHLDWATWAGGIPILRFRHDVRRL